MKKTLIGLLMISALVVSAGAIHAASMNMYGCIGGFTGIGFNFSPQLAMEIGTQGLTFANGANSWTAGVQLKNTMGGSAKSASWHLGGGAGVASQSANNQSHTAVAVWALIGFKAFITPNFAVTGDIRPIELQFPTGTTIINLGQSFVSVNVYF